METRGSGLGIRKNFPPWGRLRSLHPSRYQTRTGHSSEQPGLAWGWPSPEQETTLETSRGPVQPELSCVPMIYIFICLRSAHLLSPTYKLLFSSHRFHFPLTLFNQQTVLLSWSFTWTPLAAGSCVAAKVRCREATRGQMVPQDFHQERSEEGP